MEDNYTLPQLRQDLLYQEFEAEGMKMFILYDPKEYALQPIELPIDFLPLLQMFDGKTTIKKLLELLNTGNNSNINHEPLTRLIDVLDMLGFLETQKYYDFKKDIDEYISSPVRPPVCAGNSYSNEPEVLRLELDSLLNSSKPDGIRTGASAIVVPHIDFRLGKISHEVYSSGYQAIRESDADLFVIFGTAHYGNSDLFMMSRKDFSTPLGRVKTDTEIIDELFAELKIKPVIDEITHRNEHSIELQLVILQHLFAENNFKILPVLTGSFFNVIKEGTNPGTDEKFLDFLSSMKKVIKRKNRKVVFIASADFAHIGRKFDDDFDAEPVLPQLEIEDKKLINKLENIDSDGFFNLVAEVGDSRKICGLSPIYTLLKAVNPAKGQFLMYNQWNEIETKSAVSFASLAFYDA
ncbi:MAG: AmmeMemoRadiSam system protein B [Ignavibacteriae bacterium]|nr:AmmeMemoRadiSam system protein B [Ignavibacteriota bacterium]